jgi:hypothetical protein
MGNYNSHKGATSTYPISSPTIPSSPAAPTRSCMASCMVHHNYNSHLGKLLGHEGAVLSMVLDEENERLYTASVDQVPPQRHCQCMKYRMTHVPLTLN